MSKAADSARADPELKTKDLHAILDPRNAGKGKGNLWL